MSHRTALTVRLARRLTDDALSNERDAPRALRVWLASASRPSQRADHICSDLTRLLRIVQVTAPAGPAGPAAVPLT
ncbi:hypothetical protein [Puniceibacterium sp. IMCC21224]|uniref:hypothetical protein n=1 Tax=Puniceibacterium sp. IMCC21224 TaxID=1618204 RepID=UPI00065D10D2|nr:hypothetical protein [Puniceibacterium sp. IMCC21224]KMK66864.1 hypothetical protein IMCC21224_111722 [Puniceibacterium sp. IMCC21224]